MAKKNKRKTNKESGISQQLVKGKCNLKRSKCTLPMNYDYGLPDSFSPTDKLGLLLTREKIHQSTNYIRTDSKQ